jgi:hypothetical protein
MLSKEHEGNHGVGDVLSKHAVYSFACHKDNGDSCTTTHHRHDIGKKALFYFVFHLLAGPKFAEIWEPRQLSILSAGLTRQPKRALILQHLLQAGQMAFLSQLVHKFQPRHIKRAAMLVGVNEAVQMTILRSCPRIYSEVWGTHTRWHIEGNASAHSTQRHEYMVRSCQTTPLLCSLSKLLCGPCTRSAGA